jgi:hypothetical protein
MAMPQNGDNEKDSVQSQMMEFMDVVGRQKAEEIPPNILKHVSCISLSALITLIVILKVHGSKVHAGFHPEL